MIVDGCIYPLEFIIKEIVGDETPPAEFNWV